MKKLLPLLVVVLAAGYGLWTYLNPIPAPPLPTITEMQTIAGEQPEEVVRVAATAIAWLMWVSLVVYTIVSIRDAISGVLNEARVEARIEKAERRAAAKDKRGRKDRRKAVVDPQRSITLRVAPRQVKDAA